MAQQEHRTKTNPHTLHLPHKSPSIEEIQRLMVLPRDISRLEQKLIFEIGLQGLLYLVSRLSTQTQHASIG